MASEEKFHAGQRRLDLAGVLDLLVSMGTKATMAGTDELGAFLGGTLFFFEIYLYDFSEIENGR